MPEIDGPPPPEQNSVKTHREGISRIDQVLKLRRQALALSGVALLGVMLALNYASYWKDNSYYRQLQHVARYSSAAAEQLQAATGVELLFSDYFFTPEASAQPDLLTGQLERVLQVVPQQVLTRFGLNSVGIDTNLPADSVEAGVAFFNDLPSHEDLRLHLHEDDPTLDREATWTFYHELAHLLTYRQMEEVPYTGNVTMTSDSIFTPEQQQKWLELSTQAGGYAGENWMGNYRQGFSAAAPLEDHVEVLTQYGQKDQFEDQANVLAWVLQSIHEGKNIFEIRDTHVMLKDDVVLQQKLDIAIQAYYQTLLQVPQDTLSDPVRLFMHRYEQTKGVK